MGFRTLHELDHTEGTVQLVASNGASGHFKGTDVVLVPQVSDDVNDPLRWPQWKKLVAFVNVCVFTALTNASSGGLTPALYIISLEFDEDVITVARLIPWAILVLGLGNFFWVPAASYLGKRPIFVTASLILFAANIWGALSSSYSSLFGSRLVAAFAGASTEALGAAIVNDLFFLHERGSKMGIYIISLSWGNSLSPVIGGYISGGPGWRYYLWLCAALSGANFLCILLLVPETRFARDIEQSMTTADLHSQDDANGKPDFGQSTEVEAAPARGSATVLLGKRKTWIENLSLFSGIDKESSIFHLFLRPFPLIVYPAVIWAILGYSVSLAWVIAIGTVNSFILQAPPYNFSPSINGLINVPAMIGNLFGAFTGGYLTDVYCKWCARRNDGVFRPETRLHLLFIPTICVPIGLLLFGFGAQNRLSWVYIYVGYGFVNVGLTGVANIGMTYVMDSYFPVAAEALLLVNGLKNVVAFGFTFGITPWIAASGCKNTFGAMTGIFLGILLLAVPLAIFGAPIRHITSTRLKLIFW